MNYECGSSSHKGCRKVPFLAKGTYRCYECQKIFLQLQQEQHNLEYQKKQLELECQKKKEKTLPIRAQQRLTLNCQKFVF